MLPITVIKSEHNWIVIEETETSSTELKRFSTLNDVNELLDFLEYTKCISNKELKKAFEIFLKEGHTKLKFGVTGRFLTSEFFFH